MTSLSRRNHQEQQPRKLLYNPAKGWFSIVTFASGTINRTGVRNPDEHGCFWRRLLIGPYKTPKEAADDW